MSSKANVVMAALPCALVMGCSSPPESRTTNPDSSPVNNAGVAPTITFKDVTKQSGIKFIHNSGASGLKLMPESMGSGAAFIDFNNDGWQDIFFVNSRDWAAAEVAAYRKGKWTPREIEDYRKQHGPSSYKPGQLRKPPTRTTRRKTTGALYLNKGDGTFADVTRGSGLDLEVYGMGAAVGDYDNDGKADLYVTGVGRNYLFRNQSTQDTARFQEVSQSAGVRDQGWSASSMWVDYDKDGHLDLFVCHYVQWTPATDGVDFESLTGKGKSYTGPTNRRGEASRLYRNLGNGRFVDVSLTSGITRDRNRLPGRPEPQQENNLLIGKSLGVTLCDVNSDYWPDIFVTNDTRRNFLFVNQKNGTFQELGIQNGVAYGNSAKARAGMGVDAVDIDRSDRESFVIGNFSKEMLGLYQNTDQGFVDIAPQSEVGRASLYSLTFGAVFADLDLDGWPDIVAANGHVMDDIEKTKSEFAQGVSYAQRPLFLYNTGQQDAANKFKKANNTGDPLPAIVARGLASADWDNDGDLDLLFTAKDAPPLLLRNDTPRRNNGLRITLRGGKSNRSAIGAVVKVKLKNAGLRRTVKSGASYLSQSELPITLGLGSDTQAELLSIRWPSGKAVKYPNIAANQMLTIDESGGIIEQKPLLPELRD